jgi:hypothetical protein
VSGLAVLWVVPRLWGSNEAPGPQAS